MEKVKNIQEIKLIIDKLKQENKVIVFANGCFDILHVGHIRYLKDSKKLGDILIVAINNDLSVKTIKGNTRPIMPLNERLEILNELNCIDYLIPFEEPDVNNLLSIIKPNIHAKGTDYTKESVPEKDIVLSYGGRVAITGDPKDHSVTDVIEKIKNLKK